MPDYEKLFRRVRSALADLVGVDSKAELDAMEKAINILAIDAKDKANTLNAIDALRTTINA